VKKNAIIKLIVEKEEVEEGSRRRRRNKNQKNKGFSKLL
jgi:hypothetical protein